MSRREQQEISNTVAYWRGLILDDEANRFATTYVRDALAGDWVARCVVRSLVYEIVGAMRLPQSPLSHDMDEYRSQVALQTVERLEANDLRSWRGYMARVIERGRYGFKSFVRVAATRAAIGLNRRSDICAYGLTADIQQASASSPPTLMWSLIKVMELLPRCEPRDVRGLLARAAGHDWSTIARIAGFPSEDAARKAVKRLRVLLRERINK